MTGIPELNPKEYDYPLPSDRIAQHPLAQRDQSRLLKVMDGHISDHRFYEIPQFLPEGALLIVNQTRVIQARLIFRKESGARIEIFLLEPVSPTREINQAFECKSPVEWNALVGNSKKWKSGQLSFPFAMHDQDCVLFANRSDQDKNVIRLSWEPVGISFSEILELVGKTPLPPYMHREAEADDKVRYQTIFARQEGSVAAPTAGLHFTPEVFDQLAAKGIRREEVTLHVGAGTFKPVSADRLSEHEMHIEKIFIERKTIESILQQKGKPVIVTGTTTMRTIESLYWHGVKLLTDPDYQISIDIHQWDPYNSRYNQNISVAEALGAILDSMDSLGIDTVSGQTQLMIVPGYAFKISDILITNFHMPRSTLLMLVAAFIGDAWKSAYQYALGHRFRFLSYGDSCLFFRKDFSI